MKLWFKAKQYGYGWYPATWQGWLVMLAYFMLLFGAMGILLNKQASSVTNTYIFVGITVVLTAALLGVCYRTGEPLRWRWGK